MAQQENGLFIRKTGYREAIGLLKKYHWPGNVRELKNLVERLVIMTPEKVIQDKNVPAPFNRALDVKQAPESSLMAGSFKDAKIKFEKAFIARKLREFNVFQIIERVNN